MTNISKRQLQPRHLRQLYTQFAKTIVHLDVHTANGFFDELLGKEEKIMIAKRFTVIVMLLEGNSIYRIAQLLHMSPSTVEHLRNNYIGGKYETIEKILKKNKKAYKEFWETLEVLLRAGLPPRGKGRWKSTFEMLQK